MKKFLEKYKELELELRSSKDFKYDQNLGPMVSFEDLLNDEDKNKMRISRQIRNFSQHNPNAESFILISKEQSLFMDKMLEKAKSLSKRYCDIKVQRGSFTSKAAEPIKEIKDKLKSSKDFLVILNDDSSIYDIFNWEKAFSLSKDRKS